MGIGIREISFLIILFFTHIVQALAGFGGTMTAMPPAIMLVGADTAKIVLNIVAIVMCAGIAVKEYRSINKKEFCKIAVGMLVGMQLGIYFYKKYPIDILLKFYGAVILFVAIKNLFFASKEEKQLPKPVLWGIILVAGVIHGMFISGGALLVVYVTSVIKDKVEFRATLSVIWVVLDGYLFFSQVSDGMLTPHNAVVSAAAMIPLALALWIGNKLMSRINQQQFSKLTYILLIISGSLAIF